MKLLNNKKAMLLPLVAALALAGCKQPEYGPINTKPERIRPGPNVIFLKAGDDLEYRAQEAVLSAKPGTTIVFPRGTHKFTDELIVNTSHITLAGRGMNKTILDFTDQQTGAQGILSFGDQFTVQDFAIVNPAGDGIRTEGVDGSYFHRVKVEWTNESDPTNGAYGLYPVQDNNVLIEDSVVIGASDAGIYVGQSKNIIVRNNIAEMNVAGIEIENSQDADVYGNIARRNTGGVLVFDLPGLSQEGDRVRVFKNLIEDNTLPNFAPAGNIVGIVPAGTGFLLMGGTDQVQVYENVVRGHYTMSAGIASYAVTGFPVPDGFDAFPEAAYIFDNVFEQDAGYQYDGSLLNYGIINLFERNGMKPSEVIYDGIAEVIFKGPPEMGGMGLDSLPEGDICIGENIDSNENLTAFANLNMWNIDQATGLPLGPIDTDASKFDCSYDLLPEVVLAEKTEPPVTDEYTPEEVAALCATDTGSEVNWQALVVDCPQLSDYNLFTDNSNPLSTGNNNGVVYDLSTPLFSDYSKKHRVVFVPPGAKIDFDRVAGDTSDKDMAYPEGTVIAKTFYFVDELSEQQLVETRLLINRGDAWQRLPYVWDGADAQLAYGGASREVRFVDDQGTARTTTYQVPNSNQCSSCHGTKGTDKPLGPQPHYLNSDLNGVNQLMDWENRGILANLPKNADNSAPATDVPAYEAWDDDTATLEQRALSYLDGNCAHCHSPEGRASGTGLHLNKDRITGVVDKKTGVCKMPIAAGHSSGNLNHDIVPGDAEQSIMTYRMHSNDPSVKMPELGRSVVHQKGVELIEQWINTGMSVANGCD
ncbi:parallel beta-helix repeat protein [Sinobacterium caligoides]|uniref:Parallel beta-helix repeat protein n=1 Tax=Sinobacterium caligoides TaxID=933926 RepID=A0A3N2DXL7_9GAMM|nr:parallel beta-helix domain-containing protein [Sinobacterium caligoides]ROS04596.1 parallel beta-helix repeat protein [Sinobacterium caligoides]